MNNDTKIWPQDYLDWTGGFNELVETATTVLNDIAPEAKAPTSSIVRYYQQQDLVGRGTRKGKTSEFSFQDLSQLVATKQMLDQQVSLSVTKSVFDHVPAAYISGLDPSFGQYSSTPAMATSMALQAQTSCLLDQGQEMISNVSSQAAGVAENTPDRKSTRASKLVAGLLSQAYPQNTPPALPRNLTQPAIRSTALGGSLNPSTASLSSPSFKHTLLPGLVVEIDPYHSDKKTQAAALRHLADQLDPPSLGE